MEPYEGKGTALSHTEFSLGSSVILTFVDRLAAGYMGRIFSFFSDYFFITISSGDIFASACCRFSMTVFVGRRCVGCSRSMAVVTRLASSAFVS